MNPNRTYRPPLPQIPADPLRGNPCDSRDPRRCVPPLKGLRNPRTASVSYLASVPAGHGGCEGALSCRASSPGGETWSFPIEGNLSVTPTIVHCSFYIVHCFTFSAKERDPETGLSYFGSRYYSSDLSVWLSVDPMAHKYPSLSPYVYCADNPVKLVDPNGEEWVEVGDVHGINNSSSLNLTLPSLPQKKHTREQMIESKLSSVKVGESISGTELAEAIGIKKISLAVNKITRTGESTFSVDRKLLGKSFLKDSPLKISKEKLKINGKEETVYRVQIQYTKAAERMNMLSDFYINNDDILYYDKNGKLCKGSDH